MAASEFAGAWSCSGRLHVRRKLGIAHDHGQKIIEVVRDAARQPSDAVELLGL